MYMYLRSFTIPCLSDGVVSLFLIPPQNWVDKTKASVAILLVASMSLATATQ